MYSAAARCGYFHVCCKMIDGEFPHMSGFGWSYTINLLLDVSFNCAVGENFRTNNFSITVSVFVDAILRGKKGTKKPLGYIVSGGDIVVLHIGLG